MAKNNGSKKRGTHTTVIEAAERVIQAADKEPSVTGVSAGRISQKGKSAPRRIDIKSLNPTQLQIKVHQGSTVQKILIWTTNQARVEQILRDAFGK